MGNSQDQGVDTGRRCTATSNVPESIRRPAAESGRALDVAAGLLMLSGFVHTSIWLCASGDAAEWEGPLSWRKPILFGVSGGLTAWSLARTVERLKPRSTDRKLVPMTAVCLVIEVALISLQTWRGVPSHFNRSTNVDAAIEFLMLLFVTQVVLAALYWTVRAFRRFEAEPATKLAYRAGLVFLLAASLLGYGVTIVGSYVQTNGGDPAVYGDAGVLKFPHGMPIHAIQILPSIAWCVRRVFAENSAIRVTQVAISVLSAATVYAVVQTALGASRFPPTAPAMISGLVALMLTFTLVRACKRS